MRAGDMCCFIVLWETVLLKLNPCFGLGCFRPQKLLLRWWVRAVCSLPAGLGRISGERAEPRGTPGGEGLCVRPASICPAPIPRPAGRDSAGPGRWAHLGVCSPPCPGAGCASGQFQRVGTRRLIVTPSLKRTGAHFVRSYQSVCLRCC